MSRKIKTIINPQANKEKTVCRIISHHRTPTTFALALENNEGVKDVDFETVWGQRHTEAERTGDSTSNFIEWVNSCMK